jgi:hypothetical protein
MKLITSLSVSVAVLLPAIAFAEYSPGSTGTVSQPNQEQPSNTGGQKFYPDWAAVKKIAAPSSQGGASVKPNEASNQQQQQQQESINSSSSAKEQPGIIEKAGRLMGTITGQPGSSNESESGASKAEATGQANPPMGESNFPDSAAVKKTAGPSSQGGPSVKPNEASSQQQPESRSVSTESSSSGKDQPGLLEKAERLIGTVTGQSVSSNESESGASAADKPKVLGTLTGVIEIAPGNSSAANEVTASTTAALQGRTSVPILIKGELKVDQSMNAKEGAAGTSSR